MSETKVILRGPRAGDGDGLACCWLDAGTYYAAVNPDLFQVPEADSRELEEWLLHKTSEDTFVVVAEGDDQVVGFAVAVLQHPSPAAAKNFVRELSQTRVVVDILVVQAAYRGQGIGTRLMVAVEEWARSKGASVMLIDTYIESELSVPFYERRMGYKRRAVRFRKAFE
ncbi:MAG: GNAT family N-acetyltransferase [Chloroflexota bacterium]|nr:GNAT family N-acetyltransferase [Chloroflexota bacterium]